MNDTVSTKYWRQLEDGRVQCDLCPRFCKLREGQRGLCFVRACQNNQVVLTTYGRSSGFCVDPIEKKPLNHFLPGTPVLSFGTAGCNLACRFCQNWDISKSREFDTLADSASPETIAACRRRTPWTAAASPSPTTTRSSSTSTPSTWPGPAANEALRTVAVTAGEVCDEPRARSSTVTMDAANVDLKAFTQSGSTTEVCAGHLQPVLDTLVYL